MTFTTRYCVLDVETSISDLSASLLPAGTRPTIERAALQELIVATTLVFECKENMAFDSFRLCTAGGDGSDEPTILCTLNDIMKHYHSGGGILVTFNGSHDLSILRRRAARHWLFSCFDMDDWPTKPGGRHLDLMRLDPVGEAGRWPSLIDACAGYGINAVCETRGRRSAIAHDPSRKNQVDVVATALLLLHHLSIRAKSPEPLIHGWSALSSYLRRSHRDATHLRQFHEHPYASMARRLAKKIAPASS